MKQILERTFIEQLASQFQRSPKQRNKLHESDAEIIQLSPALSLAVTTDSIAEEIATGLYADPCLIGWMAVMVNLSDLAAVGAQPIGVLISEVLPPDRPDPFLDELQYGIQAACSACNTFVLGGDTNAGNELLLTGTAIGICPNGKSLFRTGAQPGDLLYATGKLGLGNAYALACLKSLLPPHGLDHPNANDRVTINYRPLARLIEGQSLVGLATSCMDSSDGAVATLDELMRLNGIGFRLNAGWEDFLHSEARSIGQATGFPLWLFLAGQHGEFELLFTVPSALENELRDEATRANWQPILLGSVTDTQRLELPLYNHIADVDSASVRNLAAESQGNLGRYVEELLSMDEEFRKGVLHHANS